MVTGMPERSGRRVLSQLLKDRLLASDGPKGAVSFNFPLDALNIMLATTDLDTDGRASRIGNFEVRFLAARLRNDIAA